MDLCRRTQWGQLRAVVLLSLVGLAGCAGRLPDPVLVASVPVLDDLVIELPVVPEPPSVDEFLTPDNPRYRWRPYGLYKVMTELDSQTAIILAPGERFVYFGLSDTERWKYDKTYAGDGASKQVVLLIKPTEEKLKAKVVMTTSWGVYQLVLMVHPKRAMGSVSWVHPQRQQRQVAQKPKPTSDRYQLRVSGTPLPKAWLPRRVWNDGKKTYIECPEEMLVSETPLIFVRNPEGLERVNRILKDSTFEVHRLAAVLEMRIGPEDNKHAQVVRVERLEGPQ
jgi:type IV secretory pathway VirB9-like protein